MWLDRLRKMKEYNQRIDRHEWSIEKIAIKSEVPKQTLEKIFSGSTKDPKLMTMQRLVYTLGYTLDDLFDEGPLRDPGTPPIRKLDRDVVESEITEAYQNASEDDKAVVDAALRKYIKKKNQQKVV